ncbi:GerW family sporulation protein [Pelotomaculum propionicicum]|uniref:GerW family sporulation protein n=1 Tax=Pelotomaculum propionicicum TaxID=258475 RepID=UPI003B7B21C7
MPEQHPIEGLMKTAMESIKEMVDVNTVVGDPVEAPDGTVIIPISRVACGFAAGGGEFEISADRGEGENQMPAFGGGSGAGVSVKPIGFLVVGNGQIRLLPVDGNAIYDRLIDVAPQVLAQIQSMFGRGNGQSQAKTAPQAPGTVPPVLS